MGTMVHGPQGARICSRKEVENAPGAYMTVIISRSVIFSPERVLCKTWNTFIKIACGWRASGGVPLGVRS